MPTSETVKLLTQLQTAAENDARTLLEFHGNQLSDFEGLLSQINNKVLDDKARSDDRMERIEALKSEELEARKASAEFFGKVTNWLEEQICATRRRMAADAGERQPGPIRAAEVRPIGRAAGSSMTAIATLAEKPAGHVGNGAANDLTNGSGSPAAAVN